jgi:flagellar biosynthesis/type III secretory pathway chaperone
MTLSQANNLGRLTELVNSQRELIAERFIPLLKNKQQALVANDFSRIEELASQEHTTATELAQLEAQRLAAVGVVARDFHLDPEQAGALTIAELVGILPPGSGTEELAKAAGGLVAVLEEVAILNADNRHLTENLLSYTRLVLRAVTHSEEKQQYGADGSIGGVPRRAMVDDMI